MSDNNAIGRFYSGGSDISGLQGSVNDAIKAFYNGQIDIAGLQRAIQGGGGSATSPMMSAPGPTVRDFTRPMTPATPVQQFNAQKPMPNTLPVARPTMYAGNRVLPGPQVPMKPTTAPVAGGGSPTPNLATGGQK